MTFSQMPSASCPLLQYQSPYSLHLKQRPRINLHNFNELTERYNFSAHCSCAVAALCDFHIKRYF